jgi:hypothetical protein
MLGELNTIGSEDAVTKQARGRLAEKNEKGASPSTLRKRFVTPELCHPSRGRPDSQNDAQTCSTTPQR